MTMHINLFGRTRVNEYSITLIPRKGRDLFSKALPFDFVGAFIKLLVKPGPEVIKLLSCSTQLNTKFQLLIKLK